jgi:glutaminyl-tRNA synthetase
MRDDLNARALRRIAVLDPLKLVIDNYPEGQEEECLAPNHPQQPELGKRAVPFSRELWIEREDFTEAPPKGYFRLFPGNMVRLRYGYVVKCTGCDKDADGNITAVHCEYMPDEVRHAGRRRLQGEGQHPLGQRAHAYRCEVRLYDRLFREPRTPARAAATTWKTSTRIRSA